MSHESGEELPAGQMADTGQSLGVAHADCQKYTYHFNVCYQIHYTTLMLIVTGTVLNVPKMSITYQLVDHV